MHRLHCALMSDKLRENRLRIQRNLLFSLKIKQKQQQTELNTYRKVLNSTI